MSTLKTCSTCKTPKPVGLFSPDTRKAGAYYAACKDCRNAKARNKHANHVAPTQEYLISSFDYCQTTGVFTDKKNGRVVGHKTKLGYASVFVSGVPYGLHRLAWLYVHGYLPEKNIDHINGDKLDNSISNLREATQSQNAQNRRKAQANNACGVLGVHAHQGGWRARLKPFGQKAKCLGVYKTIEEASFAYLKAKRELHEFCTI